AESKISDIMSTDPDVPALRAYVTRVGAKQRNFKRYVVEETTDNHYKRVVATIKITDGKINCDNAEYAPTDDEVAAIEAELTKVTFPKSIPALKNNRPSQLAGVDPKHYYVFHDLTGEKIIFIQWRKDGEKPDLPFSFWDDGEWRMMEPD